MESSTSDPPDEERPGRKLTGPVALFMSAVGAVLAAFAIYNVFQPSPVLWYRMLFLAAVLPMTFLAYRPAALPQVRRRLGMSGMNSAVGTDNPTVADWSLAALSVGVCVYPVFVFDDYVARTYAPTSTDLIAGVTLVVLLLVATWRSIGPILPLICGGCIVYAYFGHLIPVGWLIGHNGYDLSRQIAAYVMGTEGVYGVPLAVASTYIILFTVYGAVLQYSGAGKFFIDLSFAAFGRSRSAPGRTVTMAGFLLGTVSGSGTATAVSVGSVSWPVLKKAGYPREVAGGVLAAASIGAIMSPPTMGAAAFIIAELLGVSYFEVLVYAIVPMLLYYLGILLAIEIDARRLGIRAPDVETGSFWRLLGRFGYHFSSLVVIVVLLAMEVSAYRAVVFATVLAFALSFLDRDHRMSPRRVFEALAKGTASVLPVATTCAAAGIIVGTLTLTGLGLSLSDVIVDLATVISDNATVVLILTCAFSACAVLLLGLAVPVTASFIIAAVTIAPAMTALGVDKTEAYMFIFYYAVLSEVTPPTALAAVAAAAITGGEAIKTMMLTWKYTLPAFLVPFAFVLTPNGAGLLGEAGVGTTVLVTVISGVAVAALAVVTGKWILGPAGPAERLLCLGGALCMLYLKTGPVLVGAGLIAAAVAIHLMLRSKRSPSEESVLELEETS